VARDERPTSESFLSTFDWGTVKLSATVITALCEACKGVVEANVTEACAEKRYYFDKEILSLPEARDVRRAPMVISVDFMQAA
jgi:hypothetical protein